MDAGVLRRGPRADRDSEAGGPRQARRRLVRGPGFHLHVGIEKDFVPAKKAHPALLTDDLDGLAACVAGEGRQVRRDDPLRLPDGTEFAHLYVTDPVGNRLEFLQPLG